MKGWLDDWRRSDESKQQAAGRRPGGDGGGGNGGVCEAEGWWAVTWTKEQAVVSCEREARVFGGLEKRPGLARECDEVHGWVLGRVNGLGGRRGTNT